MTIEVLEHNGIYTAYRRIFKRGDDGRLFESVKRIDFTFPPFEATLNEWALSLTPDALDVGMQIFFDRWNFGNGTATEGEIYNLLCDEHQRRKNQSDTNLRVTFSGTSVVTLPATAPTGTLVLDTTDNLTKVFDGTKWVTVK